MKKIMDAIVSHINLLEAMEKNSGLSKEEKKDLELIRTIHHMLARAWMYQDIMNPEMAGRIKNNPLMDHAFCLISLTGELNHRVLLRYMIQNSGMSQKDLAGKADVRPNTISDYLSGKSGIRMSTYEELINQIIKSKN